MNMVLYWKHGWKPECMIKWDILKGTSDKRLNPENLFPGAKSLVVTGLSYSSENKQKDPEAPVLSRYTYGLDYHDSNQ